MLLSPTRYLRENNPADAQKSSIDFISNVSSDFDYTDDEWYTLLLLNLLITEVYR